MSTNYQRQTNCIQSLHLRPFMVCEWLIIIRESRTVWDGKPRSIRLFLHCVWQLGWLRSWVEWWMTERDGKCTCTVHSTLQPGRGGQSWQIICNYPVLPERGHPQNYPDQGIDVDLHTRHPHWHDSQILHPVALHFSLDASHPPRTCTTVWAIRCHAYTCIHG